MLFTRLVPALLLAACGTTDPDAAPADRSEPGPMRPHPPDVELDNAPPIDITIHPAMVAWLGERVKAAHAGIAERVRLPVVRRPPGFCDCPETAIAPTTRGEPFYWIHLDDRTSAGIPPGEWLGWVEGRFTTGSRTYRSNDNGGIDMVMTVFEVYKQRNRAPNEAAYARYVRTR